VLAAAEGDSNQRIVARLKIPPIIVSKWRRAFAAGGLEGVECLRETLQTALEETEVDSDVRRPRKKNHSGRGLQPASLYLILSSQQEPLRKIILSANVGQTPISTLKEIGELLVIQT
jgi:Homeodomain-like domain